MMANELITAAKRLIIGAVSASMLISTTALSGCGEKKQSGSRLDNIVTVNAVPELEPLGLDSTETLIESLDLGLSVPEKLKKAYKNVGDTNPISPNLFFADPTSVEYNGRIYLYGTCDQEEYQKNGEKGDNTYGGIDKISCFSTADMKNWTYHGDINVSIVTNWAGLSWAPSIISRPTEDGTTEFFLYFTTGGGGIGVLKATSPLGPWTDPIGGPLLAGDTAELKDDPICWVFDPGACIDDDGVGWLAFGGGDPQQEGETGLNTRNCRIVRLGEDMVSLDSKIEVIEAPYHFEANELNYIDGKFYL
ncbi:MAG TPA: family 43 glycosylhydrolase, partial [Candidatus Faeciplasma avium]|nr:family 43 glycosylhydrolase [Candidatus Faeciplasma avium]